MAEVTVVCEKCGREMYVSSPAEDDTVAWKDICKYCRKEENIEDRIVHEKE